MNAKDFSHVGISVEAFNDKTVDVTVSNLPFDAIDKTFQFLGTEEGLSLLGHTILHILTQQMATLEAEIADEFVHDVVPADD